MPNVQPRFNYDIQCWIVNGRVVLCGHPASMRHDGSTNTRHDGSCCNAYRYAGMFEGSAVEANKGANHAPIHHHQVPVCDQYQGNPYRSQL